MDSNNFTFNTTSNNLTTFNNKFESLTRNFHGHIKIEETNVENKPFKACSGEVNLEVNNKVTKAPKNSPDSTIEQSPLNYNHLSQEAQVRTNNANDQSSNAGKISQNLKAGSNNFKMNQNNHPHTN